MASSITILGEKPFARDEQGKLKSRIGTVFPRTKTLVTVPVMHAIQRREYIDHLNRERKKSGLNSLDREREHLEWNGAVDLIFDENAILIRADPENMPLAYAADELLQTLVPKHRISFLGLLNEKIREPIFSPIRPLLPTPILKVSWNASPGFGTITGNEERRSTRCSSTARATPAEASPTAGKKFWRGSTKRSRSNLPGGFARE